MTGAPTPGDCLFCVPGHKILCESMRFYARFDTFPANCGHVEIVPRRHIVSLWELSPDEVFEAWSLLTEARALLDAEHHPDAWTVGVNEGKAAGRSVDHLHIHLIPRFHGDVPDPRGGVRRCAPNCRPDEWGGDLSAHRTVHLEDR
ncbi:HIT family protein [Actinomadura sp. GTD37]|uniref:HIT family protein n=1 Tax=Actinomadura sp. GTD37 TaxID=1778030 RepID=UPI0035C11D26